MRSGTAVLLGLLAAAAGCAPREAFFRPADRRAVGRDGYVGAAYRVPPGGNRDAEAVAALGPLRYVGRTATGPRLSVWRLCAVIEFRNKRKGAIAFLPASVQLASKEFTERKPIAVTRARGSEKLSAPVEIPHWHRACFRAAWELRTGEPPPQRMLLLWEYRYGGKAYAQKTAFALTDSRLAERSLAGDPVGMTTDVDYRSESGVPFLMSVPFVGALFRSGTTVRSRSTRSFGTAPPGSGTWWPLEDATEPGFGVRGSGFGKSP
ncbi:MAG: hypothetical protein ACYTGB_04080 [Planctomycetota bacterium]